MLIAILTLAVAGIIKGAIGAGVPVIVVPVLTMLYDVQIAIAVLLAPNLISNAWQVWHYRRHLLPADFLLAFSLSGGLGVAVGTWALVVIDKETLSVVVAGCILLYLAVRLLQGTRALPYAIARRLVLPLGGLGGVLQGAAGMSAPVSVSFLNAMQLDRRVYIGSISTFFTAITVVQIPAMLTAGLLTWPLAGASVVALGVIAAGMPLGARLGRQLSRHWLRQGNHGPAVPDCHEDPRRGLRYRLM
ncbi:sulfite exporter TauE/SafE family protein [Halomonas campisalis]|uniref:sulfite exporter TauE/SafE family protein n=1 Tax=Billgrantia campisalis TaxID=74661 RepID=UPI001EEFF236|nr:sulfite exporter TauE/SafE family protein [Halomonas campisalis]MDR5861803.1 sulfite exporter TauE/SafE family protein [Halomonas campisalis]